MASTNKLLATYQLGDSLGKGAFGQVYRALNWATGETVAIKEIQLSNIPKNEIGQIMSEIDLLKNLNHPNIVKYKGFEKTPDFLYIILEFCENGSLHAILKRFGKFPEALVAVYTAQVLDGLLYLHSQGVIHRDIKGANILTNKDGCVKLADFGVASTVGGKGGGREGEVVGSPYWMAPEVIEQTAPTTASDIWSLGCTVIELLTGKPPYHSLSPMPALFRIVQDDCPPIPESCSPVVRDFLMACFQKDKNLRVGAGRLLKHQWIVSARRQLAAVKGEAGADGGGGGTRNRLDVSAGTGRSERPLSGFDFDEAVLKVQEWNEALRSPSKPVKHPHHRRHRSRSPSPTPLGTNAGGGGQRPSSLVGGDMLRASTSSSSSATPTKARPRPSNSSAAPFPTLLPLQAQALTQSPPHVQQAKFQVNVNGAPGSGSVQWLKPTPAVPVGSVLPIPFSLSQSQLGGGLGTLGGLSGLGGLGGGMEPEEEEDDNWDDDFEEGISVTKLQALEKTAVHESKGEKGKSKGRYRPNREDDFENDREDNARTIRPSRSPLAAVVSLPVSKAPSPRFQAIEETFMSDGELEGGDGDFEFGDELEKKVSEFKLKTQASTKRGLFHPDDIKTHGLNPPSPGPRTAPLPGTSTSPPKSGFSSFNPQYSSTAGYSAARPIIRKASKPGMSFGAGSPGSPGRAGGSGPLGRSVSHGLPPGFGHHRSSSFVGSHVHSHSHSGSISGPNARATTPGGGSAGDSFGKEGGRKVSGERGAGSGGSQGDEWAFGKYMEGEEEEEDWGDVFGFAKLGGGGAGTGAGAGLGGGAMGASVSGGGAGKEALQPLKLHTRLSNQAWLGDDDDDEEDPFAEIDEGFAEEDLEANLQRDKYARLCGSVNQLIDSLTPSAPDFQLREACDSLLEIIMEAPEMQSQLVSAHGMLAIMEVLESRISREVTVRLLQIVNALVTSDMGFLESFCLIGGIPVMMGFTSKKYPAECRLEASNFIRLLCHSSVLTLQMFISCRGLKVLVDLLDEDYTTQTPLVVHALNGICSVFELQSPTTKNDFCRMFIREGLLDPLSSALLNVMSPTAHLTIKREKPPRWGGSESEEEWGEEDEEEEEDVTGEMRGKIIQIVVVFCQVSQSDIHVRNALGTRKVVRRLLRACEMLDAEYLVHMLKALKHLSMSATLLEVLQNANAIEILVKILDEQSSGPYSAEICNHVFQTCYNLCRLNKSRQEEAAQAGIIPSLKRVIESSSPLKQFALPILCDLASSGKSCRILLWQHDGLAVYLRLLDDPYFQVSALEAIVSWLQDETARIEDELLKAASTEAILRCFTTSKAASFENILEPFLKITRLSPALTTSLAKPSFFKRITEKLALPSTSTSSSKTPSKTAAGVSKPVVRLNLLRLLRAVCDTHPNRAVLVERFSINDLIVRLSTEDQALLVRELAREILPTLAPALKPVLGRHKISTANSSISSTGGGGTSSGGPESPIASRVAVVAAKKKMRRTTSESGAPIIGSLTGTGSGLGSGQLRAKEARPLGSGLGRLMKQRERDRDRSEDSWSSAGEDQL